MLILTGVVINTLMGDSGIIDSTISTVEKSNIATHKEKIELSIIELMVEEERNITIDKIIDKVIEKDITSEENSNRDTGQVKTEGEYIYEIKEKEEGDWEVIYIGKGELAKTELAISVTKDVDVLTNKVTVTIEAKADSGIKSYTNPEGETKTYSNGEKEIIETYEMTANGTYTFTVENNKGKAESKEITISNILEGTIGLSANTSEATNKDVIITVVWPSGSEAGIKEIQVGEREWQTYEGESSQVTIEENCTIRARVTSEVGEVTSTTLEITNIDKAEPTVPTITGGSTEYATSRTISVSTASTDEGSGVAYYQYYLSSSSAAPTSSTEATGNVGSTASVTSKTFNTNYAGYYVYFRAVDNATNKGAWSEAQRLYIDVNAPTVTAKQSSVTIIQGNSNAISNYFTVSANGNAAISSTTYKEGSTTISDTSTLSVGTHTITCTVTKANGLSATASMTVIVNVKKPDYTEQSWTTAGTYTWTCPAGVTRIRVAVCGGGGGGAASYFDYDPATTGKSGGKSSFDTLISATGGAGGYAYSDGNRSYGNGGAGGSPNGRSGAAYANWADNPGGAGFGLAFTLQTGTYGQGGGMNCSNSAAKSIGGSTGGSGGYNTNYVQVTPNKTYTITVGAGGTASNTYPKKVYGKDGNTGFVLIAYGGDI